MERRQAANAAAALHARTRPPPAPPGLTAHLRRGPVRSRDDSVTILGDIPDLTPQQAIYSSTEEPGDPPRPAHPSFTDSSEAISNQPASSPLLSDQTPVDASSFETRLESAESSEIDSPSPLKSHLKPPRVGRVRTNSSDPGNDEPTPSNYQSSTDGHIDNPDPLQTQRTYQSPSFRHGNFHILSPLQHVQRLSSTSRQDQAREEVGTG